MGDALDMHDNKLPYILNENDILRIQGIQGIQGKSTEVARTHTAWTDVSKSKVLVFLTYLIDIFASDFIRK